MKPEAYIQKMMLTPLAKVEEIASEQFQLRRRMECADLSGFAECITCGRKHHYKLMDAGHFIERTHKGTKFDPNNCWPQCKYCNRHRHGAHSDYRQALVKKIGKQMVEYMEANKRQTPALWKEKLIDIILRSRARIKELKRLI